MTNADSTIPAFNRNVVNTRTLVSVRDDVVDAHTVVSGSHYKPSVEDARGQNKKVGIVRTPPVTG